MDKRSLLAIVSVFLVLILWQLFYAAPKQREMQRKRAVQMRERAVAVPAEQLAGVGNLAQTLGRLLEAHDLVGGAVAVLDGPEQAQRGGSIALEGQYGVHQMLHRARPRDGVLTR